MKENMYKLAFSSMVIFSLFSFISISIMSLHHILLIAPAIYFFYKSFKDKDLFISWDHIFLIVMVLLCGLSIISNFDLVRSVGKSLFKLKYYIIAFLGTYALREVNRNYLHESRLNFLIKAFIISLNVATLSGFIGAATGFNPLRFKEVGPGLPSGMFGQLMSYAYALSIVLSACTAALFNREKVEKYINYNWVVFTFIFNFIALYMTYRRGALIGFLASVPFFFYKKYKKIFVSLIVLLTILGGAIGFILTNDIKIGFHRFRDLRSSNERIILNKLNFKVFKNNPVFGVGFRNLEPLCKRNSLKYNVEVQYCGHAHNNYMELFAGAGALAGITFLLFILSWAFRLYSGSSLLSIILLPSVVNFSVSGIVQSTFIDAEISFILMFLYMISCLKNEK